MLVNSVVAQKQELIMACLVNAGRAAEAERYAAGLQLSQDSVPLSYCLALAHAHQGKLAEASATLRRVLLADPAHVQAQETLVGLLHRLGVKQINNKDWTAAALTLGEARRLDPNNGDLRTLVSGLQNLAPIASLQSGNRLEAAQQWEAEQLKSPENSNVTHSLSLLYLFGANDCECQGKYEQALVQWRKAIAFIVKLSFDGSFWSAWGESRRRVYPLSEPALDDARNSWNDMLKLRLRTLADNYSSADSHTDALRCNQLEAELWREQTVAAALRELAKTPCPGCSTLNVTSVDPNTNQECAVCGRSFPGRPRAHEYPFCGPIMLEMLGLTQKVASLATSGSALPNSANLSGPLNNVSTPVSKTNIEVLLRCLSPRYDAFRMITLHRYEDAIELVKPFITAAGGKPGKRKKG